MRKIRLPVLFALFFLLVAFGFSQISKWKGTMQEVDGAVTVKNRKKT